MIDSLLAIAIMLLGCCTMAFYGYKCGYDNGYWKARNEAADRRYFVMVRRNVARNWWNN